MAEEAQQREELPFAVRIAEPQMLAVAFAARIHAGPCAAANHGFEIQHAVMAVLCGHGNDRRILHRQRMHAVQTGGFQRLQLVVVPCPAAGADLVLEQHVARKLLRHLAADFPMGGLHGGMPEA